MSSRLWRWSRSPPPRSTPASAPPVSRPVNVVLVHGFTDTGAIFNRLVAELARNGDRCFAPSLQPNDFRLGVHDLALKLSARIDAQLGPSQPFVLIGQSMGGLVARDYVQNLHPRHRIRAFFELVTANQGTLWANTSPGGGVRNFAVNGPFLRALNADLGAWKTVHTFAYWTPFDLVVMPPTNARCAFGQTLCVLVPFHQSMVQNRTVIADIAAKIDALTPRPFATAANAR